VKYILWISIPNDVQWYVNYLLQSEGITLPANCQMTPEDMAVVLKHVGCSVFAGVLMSSTFAFFRLKWSTILNKAKFAVTVCSRFLTVLHLVFLGFRSLHRISYGRELISVNSSLSFLRWESGDMTFHTNANTSHWTSLVPAVFSLLQ
jgi:hypothetical protein